MGRLGMTPGTIFGGGFLPGVIPLHTDMSDKIKAQALKHASAFITSTDQQYPLHKSLKHQALSVPGSIKKNETAIVDASMLTGATVRVQARIGQSDWLGQAFLRVTLAAAGATNATFPYAGFNVIRSLRVLYGGEVLAEHTNYRAALKTWLRYLKPAQAEAVLSAMGTGTGVSNAATTVIVPLITPWGITDCESSDAQFWLPMSSLRSNITFEITFNPSVAIMTQVTPANLPANAITACSLVYYEASFTDGETLDHTTPVMHLFRDLQSFQPVKAGGAVVDQVFDTSSIVGNIESIHLYSTSNVTQVVGMAVGEGGFGGPTAGEYATGTGVVFSRATLDGQEYMRVGSASSAEASMDLAIHGFGRIHHDATVGSERAPLIAFALHPKLDGYFGGYPTSEMRSMQVLVTTGADACYEICSASTAMLTIERGALIRRRV